MSTLLFSGCLTVGILTVLPHSSWYLNMLTSLFSKSSVFLLSTLKCKTGIFRCIHSGEHFRKAFLLGVEKQQLNVDTEKKLNTNLVRTCYAINWVNDLLEYQTNTCMFLWSNLSGSRGFAFWYKPFNTVICYLKQTAFRRETSFIKMLPGVVGKAVVLCVTFALTSTAAVGMII